MGLFRTLRRGATWLSLGAAAGVAAVTVRHMLETPQPLESALTGEGRIDRKHGGDIYYNVGGPEGGPPLVLLHDFYPGASNFEFRNIFPQLARRYRVYAPDWLGFGMSEHPAVAYTGEFYASMLSGFLRDVVTQPAIVLAHGRAANIAVRAASDVPAVFERVVLVAPDVFAGVLDEPTLRQTLLRASRRVSLGIVPYALLSTRPALRWLSATRSQRAAEGVPDDDTVDRLYASAHQIGGQYALLAALTGDLDLAMPNAFALLEPPVLIVSGERDRRHPRVDMEDIAVLNPHADLDVIPDAGDSVFADQPDAFVSAVMGWLDTPASRHILDESALLQPTGAPAPRMNQEERPEPETPAGVDKSQEERHVADEEMPGTPANVVPGVSDSGQEGPATMDVAGVTTLEEPTVTLGPEPVRMEDGEAGGPSEATSIDNLLPEAGEAQPASAAEQEARVSAEPSRMPDESTTADTALSSTGDQSAAPPSEETPPPSRTASRGTGQAARQSLHRAPDEQRPRSKPRTPGGTKSSRGGNGRGTASGHNDESGGRKHSTRKNAN